MTFSTVRRLKILIASVFKEYTQVTNEKLKMTVSHVDFQGASVRLPGDLDWWPSVSEVEF